MPFAGTAVADPVEVQRHTISTLVGSQVMSGIGMSAGIAVGALLAEELSGSETLAGLATTAQVLGGALIAVPTARRMAAFGRRRGLEFAYSIAFVGAVIVVIAAVLASYPLMLAGMIAFGGGTAGNSQARYAAADLAVEARRGRDLSTVVWATTVGSVLGPNLIGPGGGLARLVGIPDLAGSFLFSMVSFVAAFLILNRWLHPDPLLVSRALARSNRSTTSIGDGDHPTSSDGRGGRALIGSDPSPDDRDHLESEEDGSLRRGLRILRSNAAARYGTVVTALGHVVMVGVMVMTPIHMKHGDAGLGLIGVVISFHIAGMYAFSPLTGMAVDRFGGRVVALAGGVVLTAAVLLAALSNSGWSLLLLGALFLLGVGWSATFVSGSTMLTGAVRPDERPAVQGVTEVIMGVSAAGGGALAGLVMDRLDYGAVGIGASVIGLVIVTTSLLRRSAN